MLAKNVTVHFVCDAHVLQHAMSLSMKSLRLISLQFLWAAAFKGSHYDR